MCHNSVVFVNSESCVKIPSFWGFPKQILMWLLAIKSAYVK